MYKFTMSYVHQCNVIQACNVHPIGAVQGISLCGWTWIMPECNVYCVLVMLRGEYVSVMLVCL